MRVLIVHQNFPGQFRHLAEAWCRRPGWQVVAIGRDTAPGMPQLQAEGRLRLLRYQPHRAPHPGQHPYLRRMEDAVLHGQATVRLMAGLRAEGWVPDLIVAHPGWGETLYAKDVFPRARLLHLAEWYYNGQGADVGCDPEFPTALDDLARLRTWNALHALNLAQADASFSPTAWQRDQHPPDWRERIAVIHEGIATELLVPDAQAQFQVPGGPLLRAGDPVITYVARNLEPYRGFHTLMRALPALQRGHPGCQVVIVGGDAVSYGRPPGGAEHWRAALLAEVGAKLDLSRVHFTGRIPHPDYRRLLQVSALHLYLSYPFVLSWSMLEAMASGCLVMAADTPPVREVIRGSDGAGPGDNGWCVPPLDPAALAAQVAQAWQLPAPRAQAMRAAAMATVRAGYTVAQGVLALERLAGVA